MLRGKSVSVASLVLTLSFGFFQQKFKTRISDFDAFSDSPNFVDHSLAFASHSNWRSFFVRRLWLAEILTKWAGCQCGQLAARPARPSTQQMLETNVNKSEQNLILMFDES